MEVLCTRTNSQIRAFTEAYKTMFNKDLEKDIIGDTSGHFQRMLVALLMANRDESKEFDQTKVCFSTILYYYCFIDILVLVLLLIFCY